MYSDTKTHAELPPLDNEAQAELHEGLLDEALQCRERQLLAALTSLAEMTARAEVAESAFKGQGAGLKGALQANLNSIARAEAAEANLNRLTAQRDALARDLARLKEPSLRSTT